MKKQIWLIAFLIAFVALFAEPITKDMTEKQLRTANPYHKAKKQARQIPKGKDEFSPDDVYIVFGVLAEFKFQENIIILADSATYFIAQASEIIEVSTADFIMPAPDENIADIPDVYKRMRGNPISTFNLRPGIKLKLFLAFGDEVPTVFRIETPGK